MLILSLFSPGFNCWTSVVPACFTSVLNLDLYVCCVDSLMSRSPSGEPNNLNVFAQAEPRARVARALNRFKPPPPSSPFITDRSKVVLLLLIYSNCRCLPASCWSLTIRITLWQSAVVLAFRFQCCLPLCRLSCLCSFSHMVSWDRFYRFLVNAFSFTVGAIKLPKTLIVAFNCNTVILNTSELYQAQTKTAS